MNACELCGKPDCGRLLPGAENAECPWCFSTACCGECADPSADDETDVSDGSVDNLYEPEADVPAQQATANAIAEAQAMSADLQEQQQELAALQRTLADTIAAQQAPSAPQQRLARTIAARQQALEAQQQGLTRAIAEARAALQAAQARAA